MIRVLNIQESITFGGVERRRLSLSKLLDKNRFELKIICTHCRGSLPDEIRANGVEIIPIGRLIHPFQWKQHKKIQQIIDDFKPHIIHGAVFEGVTLAAINGYLKRVPIIIIEETSDPQNRSWKGNLLMKLFAKISNKVIGVSPATIEYLTETIGVPKQKTKLITNGVTLPRFVFPEEIVQLRLELGIKENEVVIGSAGRMLQDSHKRFSDLLDAFAMLLEINPSAKLVLVGDGPEREGYIKKAKSLSIENNVVFTGYQSDVALYYSLFDVFTLVSAYEAFGLVIAEAMLHKLPVIATRVGGMKYIVDDEKTGFLVEPFQIKEIANKLQQLSNNIDLRERMGMAGYEKAMKEYTEERYVKQVEELYLELINKIK